MAEQSGLILPLGLRVLDLALAVRAEWARRHPAVRIAVNVSARQLAESDFADMVPRLLQTHDVRPDTLTLELTENAVVDASGPALAVLAALREQGMHVAIDDFGTGFSNLSSLRELPADIVKIDQRFTSGLLHDAGDEAIVRAVIAMAHATGRIVVAEGVETPEQAQRLRALRCDHAQGYLFSRPVPPSRLDLSGVFGAELPAQRAEDLPH